MRVSSARDWIALIALGLVVAFSLVWSVRGKLPTSVTGRGVFVHPSNVVDCQTLGSGRLQSLNIRPGAVVRKGDLLGRIDQTDIRKRLDEDRSLLAVLQSQDKAKSNLQAEQMQLHGKQDDSQRAFLQLQKQSLTKNLQDAEKLAPLLQRRLESLNEMKKEGFLAETSADLLTAQQSVLENESKVTDLHARLQQIDGQLKQLDTDTNTLVRDSLESSTSRSNQIRDIMSRIALSELELSRNGDVLSEHSGRILEVIATAGQVLTAGARIATLELDDETQSLVAIAYFPIRDGKKIQPGMQVQITPDTVERQRYGGILGTVTAVSSQPITREGAMAVVGNAEVLQGLMPAGPYIAVTAQMQRSAQNFSGYAWSSSTGPQLSMSAGLTGSVRTTIEERAPITYVLPFLRSLSGIY